MVQFTGYLIGKVQLDGAIRSEILMSLVESLLQRYQSPSDSTKKLPKFNENNKYAVECSERGLKLTSPSLIKSKDEGFESDCDSIRSIKVTDSTDSDLSGLMDFLDISKDKETDSVNSENNRSSSSSTSSSNDVRPSFSQTHSNSSNLHTSLSSGASSGGSLDNTSISSNSNLHVTCTDDSNSSSGNGSDSDEFCTSEKDKPSPTYWEPLPNASSFQSYPVEDVVFCHCDTTHPTTLIWVVRHLSKMIALVTSFRSRTEANELFQCYRELRVKLKPVKYGCNVLDDTYITSSSGARPSTPASDLDSIPFSSLPLNVAYPTEILHETQSSIKSPIFSYDSSKSLDFDPSPNTIPIPMSSNSSSNSSSSNSSSSNHHNNSNNNNSSSSSNSKVCSGINPDLKEPMKMNTFGIMMNMNSSRVPSTSSSHLLTSPMQSLYSSSHSNISMSNGSSSLISHHIMSNNYVTHDGHDEDDEEEDEDEETEEEEEESDEDTISRSTIQMAQMDSLKYNTTSKAFASSFFSQSNPNIKMGTGSISGSSSLKNLHNIHKNSTISSSATATSGTAPKVSGIVFPTQPFRAPTSTTGSGSNSSQANGTVKGSKNSRKSKPVLMVPLKPESVTTPRSRYPKESYMYHVPNVMGRSSSTFAPYQRSLNFISTQHGTMYNGNGNGNGTGPNTPVGDYNGGPIGWSNNGRQLLVPFSSWLELAEMPKIPAPVNGTGTGGRRFAQHGPKYKNRNGASSLAGLKATKGTSKILLRDASGYHNGMWATLSQRFKRNLRDNLMPKLNWMWTPPGETRPRKKPNKVTFNSWASVQIIE